MKNDSKMTAFIRNWLVFKKSYFNLKSSLSHSEWYPSSKKNKKSAPGPALWLKEDLRLKSDFFKTSQFLIKAVIFELDGYTDMRN